jgi:probable phosphoglycerate mutase
LIAGLQVARELGASQVDVRMDSKLVVEQMSGRWQIKNAGLRPLAAQAADLVRTFSSVSFSWIPRERNKRADALANAAMDSAVSLGDRSTVSFTERSRPSPPEPELPRPPLAGPDSAGRIAARKVAAEASTRGAETAGTATPVRHSWEPPAGTPLRLLLVRHGETARTAERRYSGRGDVPLTGRGLAQAAAVASRLAGLPLAAVVTSPLERCLRTAEILAGPGRSPVVVDDDLIECDFGDWEGLTFREVRERYPAEVGAWLGSTAVAPPGGESLEAVALRVARATARLRDGYGPGTVAVVSHVSPLKLMLREALAAGDAFLYRCHLDPAGMSTVDMWPDGAVSVRGVNETAHLRPSP